MHKIFPTSKSFAYRTAIFDLNVLLSSISNRSIFWIEVCCVMFLQWTNIFMVIIHVGDRSTQEYNLWWLKISLILSSNVVKHMSMDVFGTHILISLSLSLQLHSDSLSNICTQVLIAFLQFIQFRRLITSEIQLYSIANCTLQQPKGSKNSVNNWSNLITRFRRTRETCKLHDIYIYIYPKSYICGKHFGAI